MESPFLILLFVGSILAMKIGTVYFHKRRIRLDAERRGWRIVDIVRVRRFTSKIIWFEVTYFDEREFFTSGVCRVLISGRVVWDYDSLEWWKKLFMI